MTIQRHAALMVGACTGKRLSLHTSQVAHQAEGYPGFCNMKQLGEYFYPSPPPSDWDANLSQGYLPPGWRGAL